MKNRLINKILSSALYMILIIACVACDNDVESLAFEPNRVEENNPGLYKEYLDNLKKYKNSDHKVIYAWFDNSSKTTTTRAEHMAALPDSIDYIVLQYPDSLADWELKEMDEVRTKGTKLLAHIDFDAIKLGYDQIIESKINEGIDVSGEPSFVDVLVKKVNNVLQTINKYNYEGLIIGYKGKSILHMTEDEKTEFLSYQKAFIGMTSTWKEINSDKIIVFAGKPQNVIYNTSFDTYKHIIIPTNTVLNESGLTYEVSIALKEGVPADRIVVTAETTSLDKGDTKTGYWANGSLSVTSTANWAISAHDNFPF